jgi:type I restriction enzyme S subunit
MASRIEFLEQALRSVGLTELDQSTAIPSLSRDDLYSIKVPLPNLDEQLEIARTVASVEERREGCLGRLRSARKSIARIRQAILAAACSGRLTADWREAYPTAPSIEAAMSNPSARSKRRARNEEIVDLSLPDLPDSYIIATVRDSAALIEYGTSQRSEADVEGVPVLRMGNIQDGHLNLSDLKYCAIDDEIDRLILEDGDLHFNRTNSPELVGKSAVFHENGEMTFASYLIRVRFARDVADPDFVNYWINSAWGRLWARHVKTDGVSQSNINGTELGAMPLPLPRSMSSGKSCDEPPPCLTWRTAFLSELTRRLAEWSAARRQSWPKLSEAIS